MARSTLDSEVRSLWNWFSSVEKNLRSRASEKLLRELDGRIFSINSALNWELGPHQTSGMQLVISPNFSLELVPTCRRIVELAPRLPDWQFFSFKPRRAWTSTLSMNDVGGLSIPVDATTWTYVLLRYPDGQPEILLFANQQLPFDEGSSMRWVAGALALEVLLGEELVLELSLQWELLDFPEKRFEAVARPLVELPNAFGLSAI